MLDVLKKWLAPPVFPGEVDKTRRARALNLALIIIATLVPVLLIGNALGGKMPLPVYAANLLALVLCLGLRAWMRRGAIRAASIGLLILSYIAITTSVMALGTIRTPATSMYVLLIITAGLLFDLRGMMILSAFDSLAIAGLIGAENLGLLPRPDYAVTIAQWFSLTAMAIWSAGLTFSVLSLLRQEINERRRAEQALSNSEANLRAIFDASPGALCLIAPDHTILDLNKAAVEHLGSARAQLLGRTIDEILPPQVSEYRRPFVERALRQGESIHFEDTQNDRWMANYLHPILNADRQVTRLVVHCLDVTARKRTEQALRESEERYRLLVDTMPDPLFVHQDGNIIHVNAAALQLIGATSPDQLLGKPVLELVHPDYRQIVTERVRQATEQGETLPLLEEKLVRLDGTSVHVEVAGGALVIGGKRMMQVIARDITARLRAEDALRASEAKFRNFVEQSTEGFTLIDEQGAIIEWNRAREQITGLVRARVLGEKLWDIQYQMLPPEEQTPENYTRRKQMIQDALQTGASPLFNHSIEAEIAVANGERRFTQQTIFPIKTARGFWIGSASRDITERKKLEHALQAQNEFVMAIINTMGQGLTVTDEDARFILVNPAYAQMVGATPSELIGKRPADVTLVEDQTVLAQARVQRLQGKTSSYETRFRRLDGNIAHALVTGVPRWIDGKVSGTIAVITDLTERNQIEERLRVSEELYHQMFAHHSAIMLLIDPATGAIVDANLAAATFYGYPLDALRQMNIDQINALPPEQVEQARQETASRDQSYLVYAHRLASGELRDVEVYSVPIVTQQRVLLYAIIHDITLRRQAEAQLRFLSTHDALTGLSNRLFFEAESARLEHSREYPISIVVADLDEMKATNDTLGHAAGDDLLNRAANVLRAALRASDIVARIGGDEFAILLPATSPADATQVLTRIKTKLAEANLSDARPQIFLSLGAATAEQANVIEAFKIADAQMYANKRKNKLVRGSS